jgi:hypothetical protein
MISRLLCFTLLVFSAFAPAIDAAPLSSGDLRRLGYTGNYRGDVDGNIAIKNESSFDNFRINQRDNEQLPPRNRSVVTGPSGRNGFFLNLQKITGNERRITIRLFYSGISRNPDYDEDTVGSGLKIMKVQRRGSSRPQFEMKLTDKLDERAADDGEYLTSWRIRGLLFK